MADTRWTSADLAVFVLVAATLGGGCRPAAAPDLLHDVELVPAGQAPAAEGAASALWITRRAVISAARRPVASLRDGGGWAEESDLDSNGPGGGRDRLALGVDRRLPLRAARPILEARAGEGPIRAELLVGDRSSPRAERLCLASRQAPLRSSDRDCWGRALGQAPRRAAGGGAPADGGPADLAAELPPSRLDPAAPLDLSVGLSRARYLLSIQGRSLRTVDRRGAGAEDALGATLASLRRGNDWDHLVVIRADDAVLWADLIALVRTLSAAGFDAPRLEP